MARATSIKRKRSRCPERLSSCSEAAGVARSSGPLPGCPRKAKNPSAPCCSSYSAAPRQWHLGSARASPPDPSLSTTSRDGRDASDRLLQPTFQRRAPLLRVAAGEPRSKLRDTDGVCAQRRSTPLRSADPVAPKGILRRSGRAQGPTSDVPSPTRLALRALANTPAVETTGDRFRRRSAESDGFPDPGRLSSARSSREPC
jgi:hypothetical protein